jgi:hypothetical protein
MTASIGYAVFSGLLAVLAYQLWKSVKKMRKALGTAQAALDMRDEAVKARDLALEAAEAAIDEREQSMGAYREINVELDRVSWSLGGRLRSEDEPAIYIQPPGQERTKSCDEARLAWMDAACLASTHLRSAGLPAVADKIHPSVVQANQFGAQISKPPSVATARKLHP